MSVSASWSPAASGFIGRHVVRGAARRAARRSRSSTGCASRPGRRRSSVTCCDPEVRRGGGRRGLDAVVHLAALTSVLGSIERPAEFHRTNVEATAALLELAARRAGWARSSSRPATPWSATSGARDHRGHRRSRPLTPYGATKAAAEMLIAGYAGAYGMRAPVLRLSNVYGQGMGDKDSFIPRLMRAAADGEGVEIYGDGEQSRDLVHVVDVARAFVMAAEEWPSGPVIVGSGSSITVLDMLEAAREATDQPIPATHVDPKAGEMRAVVLDNALARSRGWEPSTALDRGDVDRLVGLRPGGPLSESVPLVLGCLAAAATTYLALRRWAVWRWLAVAAGLPVVLVGGFGDVEPRLGPGRRADRCRAGGRGLAGSDPGDRLAGRRGPARVRGRRLPGGRRRAVDARAAGLGAAPRAGRPRPAGRGRAGPGGLLLDAAGLHARRRDAGRGAGRHRPRRARRRRAGGRPPVPSASPRCCAAAAAPPSSGRRSTTWTRRRCSAFAAERAAPGWRRSRS